MKTHDPIAIPFPFLFHYLVSFTFVSFISSLLLSSPFLLFISFPFHSDALPLVLPHFLCQWRSDNWGNPKEAKGMSEETSEWREAEEGWETKERLVSFSPSFTFPSHTDGWRWGTRKKEEGREETTGRKGNWGTFRSLPSSSLSFLLFSSISFPFIAFNLRSFPSLHLGPQAMIGRDRWKGERTKVRKEGIPSFPFSPSLSLRPGLTMGEWNGKIWDGWVTCLLSASSLPKWHDMKTKGNEGNGTEKEEGSDTSLLQPQLLDKSLHQKHRLRAGERLGLPSFVLARPSPSLLLPRYSSPS